MIEAVGPIKRKFAPWDDPTLKPFIRFENVTKRFGDFTAVDDLTLDIYEREFFALLGPSGCGKTTLMRMLAGFEQPTGGRILLDGKDLSGIPPYKRPVNMMFQSYALFPHMTAAENVAFPLRMRRFDARTIPDRVQRYLDLVKLGKLGDRRIHELSGGQQQRVAIARALVFEPDLLLLDEPLAALDRKLREEMQLEFRRIQRELGITTIVVTHDQREAMTMADTVIVMQGGEIRQAASPVEIYRKPTDAFVADFIGSTNLIDLVRDGDRAVLLGRPAAAAMPYGVSRATLSVRPEDVELTAPSPDLPEATVTFVRDLGGAIEFFLDAAGTQVIAVTSPRARPEVTVGDRVGLRLDPARSVVLTR